MKAIITGAGSGLGKVLVKALSKNYDVEGLDKDRLNLEKPDEIIEWCFHQTEKIDLLINCAGVNSIAWLEDFKSREWERLMNVNARAIFLLSQGLLPWLKGGTILNITSNAAHMPMNCSLAYNASKAAADIMTKQLARELFPRHGITVFGVAPNKMSGTEMSEYIDATVPKVRGWSPEYAKQYQLNGLSTRKETPPEVVAAFIAYLLSGKDNHFYLNGCIIPYGA